MCVFYYLAGSHYEINFTEKFFAIYLSCKVTLSSNQVEKMANSYNNLSKFAPVDINIAVYTEFVTIYDEQIPSAQSYSLDSERFELESWGQ